MDFKSYSETVLSRKEPVHSAQTSHVVSFMECSEVKVLYSSLISKFSLTVFLSRPCSSTTQRSESPPVFILTRCCGQQSDTNTRVKLLKHTRRSHRSRSALMLRLLYFHVSCDLKHSGVHFNEVNDSQSKKCIR